MSDPKRKVLTGQYCQNRRMVVSPNRPEPLTRWNELQGIPVSLMGKKLRCPQSAAIRPHQLTSSSLPETAKAQSASIPSSNSPLDDSGHLPFDSLHHDSQHPPFSGLSHHSNTNDGAGCPPWPPTQSKAEVNFGRMCRPHALVGNHASYPQSLFKTIFSSLRASTFV